MAYRDQQDAIQTMRADIERAKQQAAHTERETRSARIGGHEMKQKGLKSYLCGRSTKAARKAKVRETKLDHYMENDERVERPRESAISCCWTSRSIILILPAGRSSKKRSASLKEPC